MLRLRLRGLLMGALGNGVPVRKSARPRYLRGDRVEVRCDVVKGARLLSNRGTVTRLLPSYRNGWRYEVSLDERIVYYFGGRPEFTGPGEVEVDADGIVRRLRRAA